MTPFSKSDHLVRAVGALTGAYVAGNVVSMDRQNYVGILVRYVKGDKTSLNVIVESSIDEGATFGRQATLTTSGGIVSVALSQYDFVATGNYWIVISPMLVDRVRISVRATGGTPTGTVGIDLVAGTV